MNRDDKSVSETRLSRRGFLGLTAAAVSGMAAREVSVFAHTPAPASFTFAAAFPPYVEMAFPSESWLAAVAGAGYTHCILQNDPFFHPEDIRVVDRFATIFDMTAGHRRRSYLAWLNAISERASSNGLKLAFEAWEPVLTTEARRLLPSSWKGPATESGETLCVSQPDAREWFLKGIETVLAAAPAMNALVLGINDGDMYVGELCNAKCPRCGSRPLAERLGEFYRDIQIRCAQVRPGFQVILYDWFWEEDYFPAIFSRVAHGTPILTRLERGAAYTPDPDRPDWSGHVYDQSLGCEATGTDFARAQTISAKYGSPVYVMPSLSGMFECSELPYVPAAGQVAKKFDRMRHEKVAGWVDFDCGGIHQGLMLDLVRVVRHNPHEPIETWLNLLAHERYGKGAVPGREAWAAFDRSVRIFPAVLDFKSIREYSGRFGDAIDLTVVHPFIVERAVAAKDAANANYFFDPHNFLTAEAMPPIRHCLEKALSFASEGKALFERALELAEPSVRANVQLDCRMAELTVLVWQSALNFYKWAAAIRGDKSIPLRSVLEDEISVTKRYRDLQLVPELEVGNMTTSWQLEVVNSVPTLVPELFDWKTSESTGTADLFDLKIKELERQLKDCVRGEL